MNSVLPFDSGLVQSIRINRSMAEVRAGELGTRRSFKVEAQVGADILAVRCIDLTTLSGDDTPGKVRRLCAKALRPINLETLQRLGVTEPVTTGAVCVYPGLVPYAVEALDGKLPVASVATGFPSGQTSLPAKLAEIEQAIKDGATEIDVVISRGLALQGKWREVYDEIVAFRAACGNNAKMKTILGVGNLGTLETVARASVVAIMAGSDTIKTSTGMEPTNATLEVGLVMVRQIRRFRDELGSTRLIGFKPAGGIRTAKEAMLWMTLMLEELGEAWTRPNLFRIGASGLLTDIERQLDHLATGNYSAAHHHAMA